MQKNASDSDCREYAETQTVEGEESWGKAEMMRVWSLVENRWQMRDQKPEVSTTWRQRSTEVGTQAGCACYLWLSSVWAHPGGPASTLQGLLPKVPYSLQLQPVLCKKLS